MLFWDLTKLNRDNNFFGKILLFSLSLHLFFIFSLFLISKLRNAIPVIVIGNVGKIRSAKVRFASKGKISTSSNHKINNMNLTSSQSNEEQKVENPLNRFILRQAQDERFTARVVNSTEVTTDIRDDATDDSAKNNKHVKLNETKKLNSQKAKAIADKLENKQNKANAKTAKYSKLPIDINKTELEFFTSINLQKKEIEKKLPENDIAYSKIKLNQDTTSNEKEPEKDKVETKYTKLDKDKTVLLEREIVKEEIKLKEIENKEEIKKDKDKIEKQEVKFHEKTKANTNLDSTKKIDDKVLDNKNLSSEDIEANGSINNLTNNLANQDLIINANAIYQNDLSIPDWEQKLVLDISQNLKMPHGFEKHEPLIVTLNIDKIGKANIEEFEGCAIPALKAAVANFFQSFIFPSKMHGTSRKLIIK